LRKELKQAAKEFKKVEEGKLKTRPIEIFKEVKASRGGARAGSGRKSPLQARYPEK